MKVGSGTDTWIRAQAAADAGRALVVDFPSVQEAKRFIARMAAAKSRNRREGVKLYPDVTDGRDLSEWAGLGMALTKLPDGRVQVQISRTEYEAQEVTL